MSKIPAATDILPFSFLPLLCFLSHFLFSLFFISFFFFQFLSFLRSHGSYRFEDEGAVGDKSCKGDRSHGNHDPPSFPVAE